MAADPITIATLLAILLTHYVGGIAAFGSTLLAMPLLLLLGWQVQPAVILLLSAGSVQTLTMVAMTWRGISWRELFRMLAFAAIGIPFGLVAVGFFPPQLTQGALGVLLTVVGCSQFAKRPAAKTFRPPRWVLDLLAFAGGLLHAAMGVGGSTLTVYAHYTMDTKEAFRGMLTFALLILNFAVIGSLVAQRGVLLDLLPLVTVASVLILIATLLGNATAAKLSHRQFKSGVAVLLVMAGAVMLVRATFPEGG